MATNNPLIAAFTSDDDDNEILVCTSNDGVSWSGNKKIGQACKGGPSLTFFNGKYWMAFRAHNKTNALLVCSSEDGVNWSGSTKVNQSSSTSPSLTAFKNKLWMAFVADNSANKVLVCSSADGEHWSDNTPVIEYGDSVCAPSLAAGSELWLAFTNAKTESGESAPSEGYIYLLMSLDGKHWDNSEYSDPSYDYEYSAHSPNLCVFNGNLWMSHIALKYDKSNQILIQYTFNGHDWTDRQMVGHRSPRAPSIARFGSKLVMGYIADNKTNALLTSTSSDGKSWSAGTKMGQASDASPSLCWKGD